MLLRDEVADLKQHLRSLIGAIDEIREELQYLNINGVPTREPTPLSPVPVLKRMAADPCAEDWNERLVIVRGETADRTAPLTRNEECDSAATATLGKPRAGKLFAEPGEQTRLF